MQNAIWRPNSEVVSASLMTHFQKSVEQSTGLSFHSYAQLHKWSIDNAALFWRLLSEFVNIKWISPFKEVLRTKPDSMIESQWFLEGKLNYAQNLLPPPNSKVVLTSYVEGTQTRKLTSHQLWNAVSHCAASLKKAGIGKGDRVAGVLINGPEAIVAMLATTSLGGIWSSCSPDFGVTGVSDRLSQISPKVVFLTHSYFYNGKLIPTISKLKEALNTLEQKPQLVVSNHVDEPGDEFWPFCGGLKNLDSALGSIEFEPMDFMDPLFILFSSGTTGQPKCITHGVGGALLQHKKELMLHSDVKPDDKLMFFTTCGWMMWNWMVSTLSTGASLVTFDGSPTFPDMTGLWDIILKEKLTHFGTSPKYLSACMSADTQSDFLSTLKAVEKQGELKTILSTGSPLLSAHFEWIYKFFPHVHLASISGGTDIVSCFMLGNPNLPVYSGEIQCPGLGMAIESWDEQAQSTVGAKGELVCVKPFVCMPVKFWNDPNNEKYIKSYFKRYQKIGKQVWHHGDFVEFKSTGGIIVHGRSDATLNPGGVRIGTAEIYRVIEGVEGVSDSVVIGQKMTDGDVRVLLFVKMEAGRTWSEELGKGIKTKIKNELTARHVPALVIPVKDIPYTRSGKKVEILVSQIMNKEPVMNQSGLLNPECVLEFMELKLDEKKS